MPDATDPLASLLAEVAEWEPPTVAVGVTDARGTLATYGPTDEVLWYASVSKPVTAYAVLLAAEQGELSLDEPVEIAQVEPRPTVRHLLAHAGGLGPEPNGRHTAPERRRVYADWAYEVLGDLVATRTGLAFERYLDAEVFAPLQMARTHLGGPAGHGVHGPLEDLLRFARELLAPTLLPAATLAAATEVAFEGLDGVVPGFGRQTPNDWGLGFEIKGAKTDHWMGTRLPPSAFGHFGLSGAFLWVDPTRQVAAAELADERFGPWARTRWGRFNDALVTVLDERA
ncbi:MAG: serine hydrolase domain-containing protein, partial [Nitriliruptoraceae bacterium]